MEIRLAKLGNKYPTELDRIEFADILTAEQFASLEEAINRIEDLRNIRLLLDFVVIHNDEVISFLNDTVASFSTQSAHWNGVKREDIGIASINTNRLMLNYLSSVKTFLDHCELYFARKFGKTSQEFLTFKSTLSSFYDNSFAYRFFYELRNYAQHCALPVNSFRLNLKRNETHRYDGELIVAFNRNILLSKYDRWKTVKPDLESLPNEFELPPLLFEMTHNIIQIEKHIENINEKIFSGAALAIHNFTKHLRASTEEIKIAYDVQCDSNGKVRKFEFIEIPFDIVDSFNL